MPSSSCANRLPWLIALVCKTCFLGFIATKVSERVGWKAQRWSPCLHFSDAERASSDRVQPLEQHEEMASLVMQASLFQVVLATEHQLERHPVLSKDVSLSQTISNCFSFNMTDILS